MRFQEVTSFPKICNEIMHHLMLSLIVMNEIMEFCVIFWCSTTESKNIVKLLAISQNNHTVSLSVPCVSKKFDFYYCGSYVMKINAVL